MTSTNGLSSSPRAARRKGFRNSSPPSVGERTLLCRFTFGSPGIAPSTTSSRPGCPAAVTETESPSQLMPSEIQRMCTSSTPAACGSVAVVIALPSRRHELVVDLDRLDEQLLTTDQLQIDRSARLASEREPVELPFCAAGRAAADGRHGLDPQLCSLERCVLGHHLERELERRRHHLSQRSHLQLDTADGASGRITRGHRHHRLGYRQLVHRPLNRSAGGGRPPVDPSPACRRSWFPRGPCRAARSAPRRSRPPARTRARLAARPARRRRPPPPRTPPACPHSPRTSGRSRAARTRPPPPGEPARPPRARASPPVRRARAR